MSTGRRQHTIPRFYLNQFLKPGWVYQRGSLRPRKVKSAKNEAVRSWYYASNLDDDKLSLDGLITQGESLVSSVYREFLKDNLELTADTKQLLSYLIALLALRVPAQVEEAASEVLRAAEQIDRMLTRQVEALGKTRAELQTAESEDKPSRPTYDPATGGYSYSWRSWKKELGTLRRNVKSGSAIIDVSIALVPDLMRFIVDMFWFLYDAPPRGFFITSDRPVFLTRLDGSRLGAGWANQDAVASFPLSPHRCLVMHRLQSGSTWGRKEASVEELVYLNYRAIASAVTAIYSPQKYAPAQKWMRL